MAVMPALVELKGITLPQIRLVTIPSSIVSAVEVVPANGTQPVRIETNRTGSTRISKFVIYHSLTAPMLLCAVIAIIWDS